MQRSVLEPGVALDDDRLTHLARELAERALRALGTANPDLTAVYELRYRGQSFELPIAGSLSSDVAGLRREFERAHLARFGHSDPDAEIELVTIRVSAAEPGSEVRLAPPDGLPAAGMPLTGPATLALPESTLLVPAHWTGTVDAHGTVHLERAS